MEKCLLILTSTDARVIVVADGTPHRTTSPTLHACVMFDTIGWNDAARLPSD